MSSRLVRALSFALLACALYAGMSPRASAEDGYELWLRYHSVGQEWIGRYRGAAVQVVPGTPSDTLRIARAELLRGLSGLLGFAPPVDADVTQDGALVLGTPRSSTLISGLHLNLTAAGAEGYVIRSVSLGGHAGIAIAANEDVGVLHGVFHFLRLMQTRQALDHLDISSVPGVQHRILDHWDNLNGSIERGYAGSSIWEWYNLPDSMDSRYTDYARACASIGINGTVLTNVNAPADVLNARYIEKTAALAKLFRPYGIRVYRSARFSAPVEIAGLERAGPLDFQPREPVHPLFGAMPKTPLILEVQITKEYLGLNTNLAYLGTMWQEVLSTDTYATGKGSTVRKVIDGSLQGYRHTGMAGVANIGSDRNWSGSHFDQSNWYAFGRLAWDPGASAESIAEDWVRMTFSNDPAFIKPVVAMMMGSRETVVDYTGALGLAHLMAHGHHYGPQPWDASGARADWRPVYYHRADAKGIGFDRTSTGSNAVSQYAPEVAKSLENIKTTPDNELLWFHHVPWDYKMPNGRTLWTDLVEHYDRGVQNVRDMRKTWAGLSSYVDRERFAQVTGFLGRQESDAKWWRDASVAYWETFSKQPLPKGSPPPEHPLQYYEAICLPYVPGDPDAPRCRPGQAAN